MIAKIQFQADGHAPLLRASISLVTFARLAWFSSKMTMGLGGGLSLEDGSLGFLERDDIIEAAVAYAHESGK
jgi:hypothetical protein